MTWRAVTWMGLFLVAGCEVGTTCVGPPGLYVDDRCSVVAADLVAYHPAFPLWSDGAIKERYVRLPAGQPIDKTNPDDWIFPVGTTLYKTFSDAGVRIETRMLQKTKDGWGVDAWDMRVYAWDAAQRHVVDVTTDTDCPRCAALRVDALGTQHDIPDGTMCRQCHSAARDVVNGYSAIQLSDGATVPGTPAERAALGYLHGNCGHCHRYSEAAMCGGGPCCHTPACLTGLRLWLHTSDASVEATDAYSTAVGRGAIYDGTGSTCRIAAGDPDASVVTLRMAARGGPAAMPRIATELVDPTGLATVRAWIAAMPPQPTVCAR